MFTVHRYVDLSFLKKNTILSGDDFFLRLPLSRPDGLMI